MASPNKFNNTVNVFGQGGMNFALDNLKVMLTNTLPVPTNSIYSDVSPGELPNGNGYITGGITASLVSSGQTGGLYKLVLNSVLWTAGPGVMGPFQYAILYDSSNISIVNRSLIAWWAYTSSITLAPTETFGVSFSPGSGVVQIS